MNSGRQAEDAAAIYLENKGYEVIERNWKLPQCEIDIVARKGGCIYFVEVKYRRTATAGTGVEYITRDKLRQMRFAAEHWVGYHEWHGDYALSALEVSGPGFSVTQHVPSIV